MNCPNCGHTLSSYQDATGTWWCGAELREIRIADPKKMPDFEGDMTTLDFSEEAKDLVRPLLKTPNGRAKIAASMFHPIRRKIEHACRTWLPPGTEARATSGSIAAVHYLHPWSEKMRLIRSWMIGDEDMATLKRFDALKGELDMFLRTHSGYTHTFCHCGWTA
jgi:hypothetical protein